MNERPKFGLELNPEGLLLKDRTFRKEFNGLIKELSGSYHLSDDVYGQKASIDRSESIKGGITLNNFNEFKKFISYDKETAKEKIEDYAKSHKPNRAYLGTDMGLGIGSVTVGSDELLEFTPVSNPGGKTRTIAALAQRAAELEALLDPDRGIPEIYSLAREQTKTAVKLIEDAALLATKWDADKRGELNVQNALEKAKAGITMKRLRGTVVAGALIAAGCGGITGTGPVVVPDAVPLMPTPGEIVIATPKETELPPTAIPTEIAPTPTLEPIPLPAGLEAVSENGQRQIEDEQGGVLGYVESKQNSAEDGYNFTFTEVKVDGTSEVHTLDLSTLIVHPSGAFIVDNGERAGFIWKKDKWVQILLDIKFETSPENYKNFPEVTYEDLTTGRLAEAERLNAEPFPADVIPIQEYEFDKYAGVFSPKFSPETGYYISRHPDKSPLRYIYFYKVTINEIPLRMATLQVLNKAGDGMDFAHFIESDDYMRKYPTNWIEDIRLGRMPSFDLVLGEPYPDPLKYGSSKAVKQVAYPLNSPDINELDQLQKQFVADLRFPDEFERRLFIMATLTWY
jgi:hypothetical protein